MDATQTAQNKHLLFKLSLVANLVLILFLLYMLTVFLTTKTQQPVVKTNQANEELIQYKAKSIPLPFNPKAKYVNNTSVYQQVIGKVVSFATESSTLTLTQGTETFTVLIPLGKNTSYIPPGFSDVKDMNKFKTGDEVTIGGSVDLTGNFQVAKFVISKKGTK